MGEYEKRTKAAEDEKNALLLERRRLKGMVAAQKRSQGRKGGKRSGRSKKAKKDFASVALEDDGNNIEQSELDLKAVAAANEKPHKRNLSFRRHLSEQGLPYFSNVETNETVWELPEGATVI